VKGFLPSEAESRGLVDWAKENMQDRRGRWLTQPPAKTIQEIESLEKRAGSMVYRPLADTVLGKSQVDGLLSDLAQIKAKILSSGGG
jgi:hypothetical protein